MSNPANIFRWFRIAHPMPDTDTQHCDIMCWYLSTGQWKAAVLSGVSGEPANHMLVALANAYDANDIPCDAAIYEIDRAGNRIA